MHARHRSAIILGVMALALFVVRWPLDNNMCNPKSWGESVQTKHRTVWKSWRPAPTEGTGVFTAIFRGGGGTPAIFAMLGGQRYLVANIMWDYSDTLFHQGKLYDMVYPMESTVTLNPSLTDAWSTYGWHLAWNIYSFTDDPIEKKRWQDAGRNVYIRAITANPKKPPHRFDLAWLYMQREGNYRKALNVLLPVVESDRFKPLTPAVKSDPTNLDAIQDRLWDPQRVGHALAIVYTKLGIFTGDWSYFEKALAVYQKCLQIDPAEKNTRGIISRLRSHLHDQQWLAEQQQTEAKVRANFGQTPIQFGAKMETLFPDGDTGLPDEEDSAL
ncbi:MAG TPA: hypothetical protein VGL77_17630 [Armatimonadota bacterium]|jgi:hypothetical protein